MIQKNVLDLPHRFKILLMGIEDVMSFLFLVKYRAGKGLQFRAK